MRLFGCKDASCIFIWLSGFFGLAAFVHLVRLIGRFNLVVNNFDVPLNLSILACVGAFLFSVLCLIIGCNLKKKVSCK